MTSQTIAMIIAFVLYLGLMVFVGIRSAKSNNSASDFFLGGRKLVRKAIREQNERKKAI